jgi:hypothetical protein
MKGYGWLRPWPLLVASVAAFLGAIRLLLNTASLEAVAFALVAVGAVCLGAWIALLAGTGYTGREPPSAGSGDVSPVPPRSGPPEDAP